MFLGEYAHALDSKNRMFIPAKYREELDKAAEVAKRYIEKRKADEAPAASAEATAAESK